MTSLGSDLRHAFRSLAKAPGLSIVAILTLTMGIGAVTAMYSAVRALVLEPFSYPDSQRMVQLWSNDGQPLSTPDYFDLRQQVTSYAELGVYTPRSVNLGGETPMAVRSISCTAGALRAFGIRPTLGRWFDPADDQNGAPAVAIISHRLWRQSFGRDPGLIGRRIRINGEDVTVVGIMPADFEFAAPWLRTDACDIWLPLQLVPKESDRGSHWLCAVGRLKDSVSLAAADAEIKAIGRQLSAAHPDTNTRKPFLARSLHFEMTRFVSSNVWMLFGAVILLLLVACANVASMLLARSARRQGEFGIRIALGATRGRMLRLILTETCLLSAAGAALGLLFAFGAIHLLRIIAPATEARKAAMALDGHALIFAIGITVLTALISGLPPAFAALRVSVSELLRGDSRSTAGSVTRHRLLRTLIIAQIAVAFVLANGAALFSASYAKLLNANSDLATEYVLSAQLNLRGPKYKDTPTRVRFWEQLTEHSAKLPGVTAAGITSKLPLEGGSNMWVLFGHQTFDPTATRVLAEVSAISPGYFAAVGIPILQGRTLQPSDSAPDNIGIMVNRAFADKAWPGQNPLGQIVRNNAPKAEFHATVVGVVENTRQWGADAEPKPEFYWSPDRAWGQTIYLNLRSNQPASALTPALRRAVQELDPDLPLTRIRTLQGVLEEATQGQRAITRLINVFMAVTLALLAVGLYGTLSYHVLQRTREIGVRMALGADRSSILRLVFRQGSLWVAIGIGLGLAGALGLATTLRAMVWGISPADPRTLGVAALAVAFAALVACWLPARRAARVDPIIALRAD